MFYSISPCHSTCFTLCSKKTLIFKYFTPPCPALHRGSPTAREGHLVLLHYLPITMETTFQAYLGRVLPAVLDGLSDDSEGVRDAALGAGKEGHNGVKEGEEVANLVGGRPDLWQCY